MERRNDISGSKREYSAGETQTQKQVLTPGTQDIAAAWDADDGYGAWDGKVRIPPSIKGIKEKPF